MIIQFPCCESRHMEEVYSLSWPAPWSQTHGCWSLVTQEVP